jgi:hypothetical protein
MLPYLTDQYGNPHSRTHAYGWEAEQAVEDARKVPFQKMIFRVSIKRSFIAPGRSHRRRL